MTGLLICAAVLGLLGVILLLQVVSDAPRGGDPYDD